MVFNDIAILVRDANPDRSLANLDRRSLKLLEEMGELGQAFLNITSPANPKLKTWDDVREEIADCLIVALDIAWTRLPGEVEAPVPLTIYENEALLEIEHFRYRSIFWISLHLAYFVLNQKRHDLTEVVEATAGMALSALPDQPDVTKEEITAQLLAEVERKLTKWADSRAKTTAPGGGTDGKGGVYSTGATGGYAGGAGTARSVMIDGATGYEIGGERWLLSKIVAELQAMHATLKALKP